MTAFPQNNEKGPELHLVGNEAETSLVKPLTEYEMLKLVLDNNQFGALKPKAIEHQIHTKGSATDCRSTLFSSFNGSGNARHDSMLDQFRRFAAWDREGAILAYVTDGKLEIAVRHDPENGPSPHTLSQRFDGAHFTEIDVNASSPGNRTGTTTLLVHTHELD